jgi:hypothetical protein
MQNCIKCLSPNIRKRGTYLNNTTQENKQRYSCNDCKSSWSVVIGEENLSFDLKAEQIQATYNFSNKNRYVITSCQNDTKINKDFYDTLKYYCEVNDAELLILRTKYKIADADSEHYFVDNAHLLTHNIIIKDSIKVFGALNLMPTLVSPLSGLESLSKGHTCIFGHNSIQMGTLPVNDGDHPIMMHTTGTISLPNNSDTKTGQKADYNHSFSALVLELDKEAFYIRTVTSDDNGGFYDLNMYYDNNGFYDVDQIEGLVLGDVHVDVVSQEVVQATFENVDSIVNVLKPKVIVYHDLLDFNQVQSHHNKNNYLKRYQKYIKGEDDIEAELKRTVDFIKYVDNDFVQENVIVSSNHIDHLDKFLNLADIKNDYKNSIIYYYLMYKMLIAIRDGKDTSAFQLYFEEYCDDVGVLEKTTFLSREDSYFIKDILISSHGDVGLSGSRFAPSQGKKFPHKMIVGHSHQPSVNQNLYVAGTCTGKLDYAKGVPSGWMNSHVVIYADGSRTHINIIKGKWKL